MASLLDLIPVVGNMIGGALTQSANKDAQKQKDLLLQGQSKLSGGQFDARLKTQGGTDENIDALRHAGTKDVGDITSNQAGDNIDSASAGSAEQLGVDRNLLQGSGAVRTGADAARDINRGTEYARYGKSATDLTRAVDAETLRQAGFRKAIQDAVSQGTTGAGAAAFHTNADAAASNRAAVADSNLAPPATPAGPNADPHEAADFASEIAKARQYNLRGADAQAKAGSDSDAASSIAQAIAQSGRGITANDTKSQMSAGALGNEVDSANLGLKYAQSEGDARRKLITDNVGRFLDTLNTTHDVRSKELSDARGAHDQARNGYYDTYGGAVGDYYNGQIGHQQDYNTNYSGASNNFEGQNSALTNYKMSGTYGYSPLGSLISTASSAAMPAAAANFAGAINGTGSNPGAGIPNIYVKGNKIPGMSPSGNNALVG